MLVLSRRLGESIVLPDCQERSQCLPYMVIEFGWASHHLSVLQFIERKCGHKYARRIGGERLRLADCDETQ